MRRITKAGAALALAGLLAIPALAQQTTGQTNPSGQVPQTGGAAPGQVPQTGGAAPGQVPQRGGAAPGQVPQRGGVPPGQIPQRGGVAPGQIPQTGQNNLGLPSGINPPLFLDPAVRRELNVNDQQMGRLNNAFSTVTGQFRDDFGRLNQLDQRARAARLQELERNFNQQLMKSTGEIFNEQQVNRLNQLNLQRQGIAAFNDPTIRQRLNLSDAQHEQLRLLNEQIQRDQNDILRGLDSNRDATLRRFNEFQTQIGDRVNTILDDRQRRIWSDMTGNRFNFPPPVPSTGVPIRPTP
jgi:hypothetical protein